ncbi:MAG: hypothetical protein GF329_22150, partial [Candidatus Lokiarchaeota archaeon]|nr:hypothetical protein [Candidatus Lokiarchaeota archaeon]
MLIFTHIPKTSGTSLIRNILRKSLSEVDRPFSLKGKFSDYLWGEKHFNEKPKSVSGHFPFGI